MRGGRAPLAAVMAAPPPSAAPTVTIFGAALAGLAVTGGLVLPTTQRRATDRA